MPTPDLLVIAVGLAAIAWVNWYFFVASGRSAGRAEVKGDRQEAVIVVEGGYDPAVIHLIANQPARLIFHRQETAGCSEEIVIPDFHIRQFLPAFERTTINLPASPPGTHEFTCGMGMLHGRLVVEENS